MVLQGTSAVSPKSLSDLIWAIDYGERTIPSREELSSSLRFLIRGGKVIELLGRLYYAGTGSTEYEHLSEDEFKVAVDRYLSKFHEAWSKLKSEKGHVIE